VFALITKATTTVGARRPVRGLRQRRLVRKRPQDTSAVLIMALASVWVRQIESMDG